MSCWEGSKPEVFKYQLHRAEELSEGLALELEREVACFYMQTFYNYFGHVSLIPHCILPAVRSCLCFFMFFLIHLLTNADDLVSRKEK